MSWLSALGHTARAGFAVERRRLEPLSALRGALGLAFVIGVSLWLFSPAVAASSAFGAYQAAIATFQRSWRPRPQLALVSGATLGISTFLGYLSASHLALFLALLATWAFLSGLSWAAGPTVGVMASSNVAIMLITITLPSSVAEAAGHAAMSLFGGLVQAALLVLFPFRRWRPHRDALADALAAEADYARRLRHDPHADFDPEPLMEAREAAQLTPREHRHRPAELSGARGLAERIRPVLASLADPALGAPAEGVERDRVRELLAAAAAVLDAAARSVRRGTPLALDAPSVATLRTPDTGDVLTGPARRSALRLKALLGDVIETADPAGRSTAAPDAPPQAAARADAVREEATRATLARTQEPGGPNEPPAPGAHAAPPPPDEPPLPVEPAEPPAPAVLHRPGLISLVPVVARSMRAELRPDSAILRHAIRVTAVALLGYLIGTLLPFGHGYWAPLAAVMVMRPDFSRTYSRAVARFGGTLLGVFAATGILQLTEPSVRVSALLAVACAALMYLLMRTGYAVSQFFVSGYVVFLLGMGGEEWTQTVPERVVLTLIGGVLAMASYALFPAWETPRLRTRLADWLTAAGRYAAEVVERYATPAGPDDTRVRTALLEARAAHTAWQEALARAAHEPVRNRGLSRTSADDAEEAIGAFSRAAMLMEAHLPERGAVPVPAAQRLAHALRTTTERGARDLRDRRVPQWDEVRAALAAWDGEGVPDRVVRRGAGMLLAALEQVSEAAEESPPFAESRAERAAGEGP
ncbi:FUSC family protein [Streptomyces albidoflavus]|uniref:FUSC family protein n=1 Tax=Streptomyces albidoflavus TaxID=1886 RepID=UPI001C47E5B4|nr:FUSC family protein [Streptomyces albidoflavus]MBV7649269.1 FUSC family protein [Streptomyces albidoflavus]MBV7710733.1 FUSC family protein [Streptomyces albidoflavus]